MQIQIAQLPEESFFGEIQILLDINANAHYVSTVGHGSTWCMSIPAKKFQRVCDQFPTFRGFLINRGILRRSFFRKVERELLIKTGIVDKEEFKKRRQNKKEAKKNLT